MIVQFDTTQAIATDRIRVFYDGIEVRDWDQENHPSFNTDYQMMNASQHFIGIFGGSTPVDEADGKFAHTAVFDGLIYDPTELLTEGGSPKDLTALARGTNGFLLQYDNASNLGEDEGTGTNDFTVTGSPSQTTDVPVAKSFVIGREFNLDADSGGFNGYTVRNVFDAENLGKFYGRPRSIRLTLKASSIEGLSLDYLGIGLKASSGNPWDADDIKEISFDSASGFAISAGEEVVSDEVRFDWDQITDLVFSYRGTEGSSDQFARNDAATGATVYFKQATDEAAVADASSGYTTRATRVEGISRIEFGYLDDGSAYSLPYGEAIANVSATQTHTFTDVHLGPPFAGRKVAVFFSAGESSMTFPVDACVVGGIQADVRTKDENDGVLTAIATAVVPTGEHANITLKVDNNNATRFACKIYVLHNVSNIVPVSAVSSSNGVSGALTAALNISADGFGIMCANHFAPDNNANTMSNCFEDTDLFVSNMRFFTGSIRKETAVVGLAIGLGERHGTYETVSAASWV